MKSSRSSEEEARDVPAYRLQAQNQSSAAPNSSAPLPVIPPPAAQPSPPPPYNNHHQRVQRNIRRSIPWRSSPYGGRQGYYSQMMQQQQQQQQPVRYGYGYDPYGYGYGYGYEYGYGIVDHHQNMVPVQVMNNNIGVVSYEYMGWNYCWNVVESWTLSTVSPSSSSSSQLVRMPPHHVRLQHHPYNPAPLNNQAALPAAPDHNSHAVPAPPPAHQPDQPADDLDLDLSLHL